MAWRIWASSPASLTARRFSTTPCTAVKVAAGSAPARLSAVARVVEPSSPTVLAFNLPRVAAAAWSSVWVCGRMTTSMSRHSSAAWSLNRASVTRTTFLGVRARYAASPPNPLR